MRELNCPHKEGTFRQLLPAIEALRSKLRGKHSPQNSCEIEIKISPTNAAIKHQTSSGLGSDIIFDSQAVKPAGKPVYDTAFVFMDSAHPLYPFVGETISRFKFPVEYVLIGERYGYIHKGRYK